MLISSHGHFSPHPRQEISVQVRLQRRVLDGGPRQARLSRQKIPDDLREAARHGGEEGEFPRTAPGQRRRPPPRPHGQVHQEAQDRDLSQGEIQTLELPLFRGPGQVRLAVCRRDDPRRRAGPEGRPVRPYRRRIPPRLSRPRRRILRPERRRRRPGKAEAGRAGSGRR